MNKEFRTIRISKGLIESCEEFLKTKKGKGLGLYSVKDVVEYFTRQGIEPNLK